MCILREGGRERDSNASFLFQQRQLLHATHHGEDRLPEEKKYLLDRVVRHGAVAKAKKHDEEERGKRLVAIDRILHLTEEGLAEGDPGWRVAWVFTTHGLENYVDQAENNCRGRGG